jgi:hypothetical protein
MALLRNVARGTTERAVLTIPFSIALPSIGCLGADFAGDDARAPASDTDAERATVSRFTGALLVVFAG